MKHKHAELIKAWAEGAQIQYRPTCNSEWFDCIDDPKWLLDFEYRIKPEPIKEKEYYPEDTFDKKYLYVYNSLSRRESWLSERELNMSATYGWQYMGKVEVVK